jgi:hypothetical protein
MTRPVGSAISFGNTVGTICQTGDGGLAPPRQRLVHFSGFQHSQTADVLLGLQIRPVGDEYLTMGLRP